MEKLNITRSKIIIELLLLLLLGLFFCLFLSLLSYHPSDPGWSQTAWSEHIYNVGGYTGAYIADMCLQFLGFVAFALPIFAIMTCLQLMFYVYEYSYNPINYFSLAFKAIGFLGFIFSSCVFLSLNIADASSYSAGGTLGDILGMTVSSSFLFIHILVSLGLLIISLGSITLITDYSWAYLFEMLGALIIRLTALLIALVEWLLYKFVHMQFSRKGLNLSDQKLAIDQQFVDEFYAQQTNYISEEHENEYGYEEEAYIKFDPVTINSDYNEDIEPIRYVEDAESIEPIKLIESIDEMEDIEPIKYIDNIDEINDNSIFGEYLSTQEKSSLQDLNLTDELGKSLNIGKNEAFISQVIADDSQYDCIPFATPYSASSLTDDSYPISSAADQSKIDLETEEPNWDKNEYLDANDVMSQINHEEESLIHPLLKRNDKQVVKPTTPLPSLDLLTSPPTTQIEVDHAALSRKSELIEQSLADFRVSTKVVDYQPGPVITRFEVELAPGVKASRITSLDRDLARSLSMPSVRVVEVIPGKPYVGIELPNENRQTVYFREVLDSPQFRGSASPLTIVLGKDIAGQAVVADLAKMPHVLVAGTTGSGKSVGVNAMILSILYKSQPDEVRFIMIDPKMIELSIYEGIPHLLTQVVTDMKDAANALNWCVNEMERRYRLMSALGVRNIAGYNEKIKQADEMGRPIPDPLWKPENSMDLNMPMLEKLPYIVVMVDEFADLIMAVGKKVEELIARLAQKARAAGIHLVLATQRPSVDVITGLIKANIPTRIAFTVSSKIDSRTILDQMGAESLLGMGDMLYLPPNSSIPIRVHGAFVRDEEVHAVVQDWQARGVPNYIENITAAADDAEASSDGRFDEELDPLFDQVVAFVIETRRASISSVQRKFRIGYNRAARIVEQMENENIVSRPNHSGNREVLAVSHN